MKTAIKWVVALAIIAALGIWGVTSINMPGNALGKLINGEKMTGTESIPAGAKIIGPDGQEIDPNSADTKGATKREIPGVGTLVTK